MSLFEASDQRNAGISFNHAFHLNQKMQSLQMEDDEQEENISVVELMAT